MSSCLLRLDQDHSVISLRVDVLLVERRYVERADAELELVATHHMVRGT